MEDNDKKIISDIINKLGIYNSYNNFVKLLFIRYVLNYPDKLKLTSIDEYRELNNIKNKLENAKISKDLNIISNNVKELLTFINKKVSNDYNSLNFDNFYTSYCEIFENKYIFDLLDLINNLKLSENGTEIKEYFNLIIDRFNNGLSKVDSSYSNIYLRKIITKILNISETDVYSDPFSGFSTSLLNIDKVKKYVGIERNPNNAIISYMVSYMILNSEFEILCKNFCLFSENNKFDKIFAEPPIGIRVSGDEFDEVISKYGSDLIVIAIYKIIESLSNDGEAVIALPCSVLFSQKNNYVDLRKKLFDENLKAVIELVPLFTGTLISTFLLYLKKGYKGKVTFVDASKLFKKVNIKYECSDETIEKIISLINSSQDEIDFSSTILRNKIDTDFFNLEPHRYIMFNNYNSMKLQYRPIKEIDDDIDEVYKKFKENLSKNK